MPATEITSTFDRPYRPAAIAIANRVGRLLSGVGIGGRPITVGDVLADAQRKMGLHDFGDEGFLEPLEVLVDSINREAALNPVGHMIIRGRIIGVLANKLVTQNTIKQHPEILDIPVEAPIVVAGLARTGTTMLQRLIARDPAIRGRRTRGSRRQRRPPRGSSTCRPGSSRFTRLSRTRPRKR